MLLIGNGRVITRSSQQLYLENGSVLIQDNIIMDIGPTLAMKEAYPNIDFMDVQGKVIMPGLINTHMHLYSTFARGMALQTASPQNFLEILEGLWWKLDKTLTLEDVYYSALAILVDLIKSGTTTIFDHHASPGAVPESLFRLAEAAKLAGIRACLCYEVSDRDGVAVCNQGIEENRQFIKACQENDDSMQQGLFGLHASFTLSDDTLLKCANAVAGLETGFHVHAAEGLADAMHAEQTFGKRLIQRFADFAVLGPKTIAAHCVHVNKTDMNLLAKSQTNVVHNPESNMGNAVGCAPVLAMVQQGIRVGLGTDGYTTDMFESLKAANLIHKHQQANPSIGSSEVSHMLFTANSQIATMTFRKKIGSLEAGALADLIVIDYDPPTPMTLANIDSHILFGMSGRAVDSTMVNGRFLLKEGQLTGLDEAKIKAKSRELAAKMWKRI